ncbi:hypothetical protein Vi05172_g9603 [Venturia inaequalis]|nr:hypothetical protein Vi05172_g9603 [Venturia inaequalis]
MPQYLVSSAFVTSLMEKDVSKKRANAPLLTAVKTSRQLLTEIEHHSPKDAPFP